MGRRKGADDKYMPRNERIAVPIRTEEDVAMRGSNRNLVPGRTEDTAPPLSLAISGMGKEGLRACIRNAHCDPTW